MSEATEHSHRPDEISRCGICRMLWWVTRPKSPENILKGTTA